MDKELEELMRFVPRNKVKNIEVIGQANANNSMTQEFYYKLSEQAFETEKEAADYSSVQTKTIETTKSWNAA